MKVQTVNMPLKAAVMNVEYFFVTFVRTFISNLREFKAWVKKLNFTPPPPPPQLHFRCGACSWIVRGFCVTVSSVYLSKFKIIETCLFLALFCLCIFVILIMALFKSHFLLILSFLTAKFGWNIFYFCFDHYIVRSAF